MLDILINLFSNNIKLLFSEKCDAMNCDTAFTEEKGNKAWTELYCLKNREIKVLDSTLLGIH